MSKEDSIEVIGVVTTVLPNAMFEVEPLGNKVNLNGRKLLAHISGRIRKFYIKILLGDYVKLEISPYDLSIGRISYRFKNKTEALEKADFKAKEAN